MIKQIKPPFKAQILIKTAPRLLGSMAWQPGHLSADDILNWDDSDDGREEGKGKGKGIGKY